MTQRSSSTERICLAVMLLGEPHSLLIRKTDERYGDRLCSNMCCARMGDFVIEKANMQSYLSPKRVAWTDRGGCAVHLRRWESR